MLLNIPLKLLWLFLFVSLLALARTLLAPGEVCYVDVLYLLEHPPAEEQIVLIFVLVFNLLGRIAVLQHRVDEIR